MHVFPINGNVSKMFLLRFVFAGKLLVFSYDVTYNGEVIVVIVWIIVSGSSLLELVSLKLILLISTLRIPVSLKEIMTSQEC